MRHLIIFLSLVLFASCSNDLQEVKEMSMPMSRSIGYEPTWWNSEERLPAPSERWSGYRKTPYDTNIPDTCTTGYVSLAYSWGTDYDWYYYNRLQVQYRKIKDGSEDLMYIPESDWKWLGEETGKYKNGVIAEKSASRCVDINAADLPKGKIGIRYRLIHYFYPDNYNANYDNVMYTEWTMVSKNGKVINNKGGDAAEDLFIHVSFPQTMASFTCSVFVDDVAIYYGPNNIYTYKRKKESGTYFVSAFMQINQGGSTDYRSAERIGTYDKNSKHIYVNFTLNDFMY